MRWPLFLLAGSFLACLFLPAQQIPLSGPVEGFTFDAPTKSFRGVMGVLGSATLGPSILRGLDYGSVAPRQNYGLAFVSGQAFIVSGLGGQVATVALAGSFTVPDGVVWSGDGSVAVIYSRAANMIETISGLPNAPNAGSPVDLSSFGGTLSSVAVDFTGMHIAVGITGNVAGVFQVSGGQNSGLLLAVSQPIALAFSDDGITLCAIDAATNRLSELNMANLAAQSWTLTGLKDAFAVKPAVDATNRKVIYVAGRADQMLVTYDAVTGLMLAQAGLSFQPTSINPLGSASFLLASRVNADEPLWSFKNSSFPSVYFVPSTSPTLKKDRVR